MKTITMQGVEMQSNAFSLLWGFAILLDFLCQPFAGQPHEVLSLLMAVLLFCKPDSRWALLLASVADLTHLLAQSPNTPNHAVLRAFVDLAIIGHFFLKGKAGALESAKPTIRLLLILVYFISVFHKWNHDFLNPQVSCASQMLSQGATWLGLHNLSQALSVAAIWGALACETLIPLLLVSRARIHLGLWLGLFFHTILPLHPHPGIYSFSGLMIAILALWIPEELWSKLIGSLGSKGHLLLGLTARAAIVLAAAIVLVHPHPMWTFRIGLALWFACAAACAWVLFSMRSEALDRRQSMFWPGWLSIGLLLLFALNGFAPYMGLQTVRVFSMFSNLRTEGAVSNHLLIPANRQWFPFQLDLVEVLQSTDTELNRLVGSGQKFAFFEVQRWALTTPKPFELTLRHRDGRITTETDRTIPQPNAILSKFLSFRAIDTSGPSKCRW